MSHSANASGDVQASGELITALRDAVSRLNHEINNPLAVISGNAQLLLALGSDLEADVREPIEDIEEASQQLSASLRKLVEMRELLDDSDLDREEMIRALRQLAAR